MIEYRHNFPLDPQDVIRVFDSSGMRRPTKDVARIARMIAGADLMLSAWSDGKLVGLCRALTDYCHCCYLADLAIDRDFQKHGIGKELIARLRAAIGEEVSLVLLSTAVAMDYYPKMGFTKVQNGYTIRRVR